jgi:ubiquinone/menaquinone biosynthesis C-methylase UbiE
MGSNMAGNSQIPVCDYEGSDYQTRFWDKGERVYEDGCEAIAIKKLLPPRGNILLELGAGAGRNTGRYSGYKTVVLLDYSLSQLQLAKQKLGNTDQYIYVVGDIYRLPIIDATCDGATMIRVLHHMADVPSAMKQVRNILQPGSTLVLEFANKRNLKAILRYIFRRQKWNPFTLDPVEYAPLNFDFHPRMVKSTLVNLGFHIDRIRTVSHFRISFLKRHIHPRLLVWLDSLFQWTGSIIELSPSVFVRATTKGESVKADSKADIIDLFKCPTCGCSPLQDRKDHLLCSSCGAAWQVEDGIYIFK